MEFITIPRDEDTFQRPLPVETLKAMCVVGLGQNQRVEVIHELPSGMFNNTYLVSLPDRKIVLRVGPATGVRVFSNEKHLLRREQSVEPFFSPVADIVPKTIFSDFSGRVIDRDFMFQTFLPGELWDEIKATLRPAENDSLWRQLGRTAKKIHSVLGKAFGFPQPQKSFDRWSDAVIGIVRDMVNDLHDLKIDASGTQEYLRALEAGHSILDEIREPRLVHGDLWPRNVLFERGVDGVRITGLLDSERALWGDPMAEWIFHDGTCAAPFWEGYGDRPSDPHSRFRNHAYTGLYAMQLYLEGWRFKQDDTPFRKRLAEATRGMQTLMKKSAR